MRFAQLGAATALVAAAQAFLLPPTITSADKDIINTLPFEDAVNIKDRIVEIDCPGCPVMVTDIQGKMHSAPSESVLRLNFSLSLNENDQLFMNDVQIYPLDPLSQSFIEPLKADQLVKSPAGTWEYAASPNLGYALAISHPTTHSNNDQLGLVHVKIEILEVADKFINGIDAVVMKLVETPSGKLMIGDVDIIPIPASNPSSKPSDSNQECTTILCKWRAIIADKLSKLKGSAKGCAGKARPGAHDSMHDSGVRPHGHGRPRPHGPHRPHRHHHRHGGFARFLRSIVLHIFIPIMIGVVIGVTTSLIGMVVGHLIIFVWRVVFRRGQRGQYHRVQQEAIDEEDDETKSFLNQRGPPPTYEEAPSYEEAVIDEKTSE